MALTKEQFLQLRQQGLSVDQIVSQEERPGIFQRVKQRVAGRGEALGEEALGAVRRGTVGAGARLGLRTAGAVGGSIFDIITEGAKFVLGVRGTEKTKEILGKTVGPVISKVAETDIGQSAAEWAKRHPEAVKDLEDILNISAAAPALRGGIKAAQVGARAGKAVARAGADITGKGLALTGATTEKIGHKVVSLLYSPTLPQAQRVISHQARTTLLSRLTQSAKNLNMSPETLADVVIKYGLAGLARPNIGSRARRISSRLWKNQVEPVLGGIKEKVSKNEIFDVVRKEILKKADISQRKSLLNAMDAFADDFKHISSYSYKTLNKVKSEMAKRLPAKVWKGQDIAGDINNVRRMFSNEARKIIRAKLPREIKDIFDDYGSLLEIAERGAKALTRGFDAGILGVTSEAIRVGATPIATIGGVGISKAGTLIKKAGQKLLK